MKKVLIAYISRTGKTQQMADFVAEGVRMTGNAADVKKITELKTEKDLQGYDGYVFGSPTYHRTMPPIMETFLFMAHKAGLTGKVGGAFGSYTHSGDAPKIIFDTMENVYKMNMVDLGAFNLLENLVEHGDGLRSCQEYGKAISKKMEA